MLKTLTKHLFGIALTWVVVLVGTFFLLRWYSQPSAEREVPSLEGMAKKEAQERFGSPGVGSRLAGFDLLFHGESQELLWNNTHLRAVRSKPVAKSC